MHPSTHLPISHPPAQTLQVMRGLFKSMRPRQWTKNAVVFAALVFDGKLFQAHYAAAAFVGFVSLCLLSSAVYLINDVADINADRVHPTKRNRPIARGAVPVLVAVMAAITLVTSSLLAAFAANVTFGFIALAYLIVTTLYTFKLKHVVLVDVMAIATGFVLRVAAGAMLVQAARFSPWLFVCMSLLALLIGFGKRRQELKDLGNGAGTRAILRQYNLPMLDQVIGIITGALIVSYMFYTFSAPHLPANNGMMLTIPFVMYGVLRYLQLVHVKGEGAAPDELVLKDRPMQIALGLWGLAVVLALYVWA